MSIMLRKEDNTRQTTCRNIEQGIFTSNINRFLSISSFSKC
uniref:Uncharacterized protein n=1 Tax=Rhizophora mucronata TaxID=61149 RepID=A0A2P2QZX4_RHIMU